MNSPSGPPQVPVGDRISLKHRLRADPGRAAVSRRFGDELRRDVAVGPGLNLVDDGSSERLRHVGADDAPIDVDRAPGCGTDHEADGSLYLRGRAGENGEQHQARAREPTQDGRQMQEASAVGSIMTIIPG
jgi:hypothetical protein